MRSKIEIRTDVENFKVYYRGNLEILDLPKVAIVGTRKPNKYAVEWTRKIVKLFVENGFVTVSGLAFGIDTAVHKFTLDYGGKTIAVLPSGLKNIYPASNEKLALKIIENQGLLITEYDDNVKIRKYHFHDRNRIIAALADSLFVMQAPIRSGTLITANWALEYGREIYVLPHRIEKGTVGSIKLMLDGANFFTSLEEIAAYFGFDVTGEEKLVKKFTVEDFAKENNISYKKAVEILIELEKEGKVKCRGLFWERV